MLSWFGFSKSLLILGISALAPAEKNREEMLPAFLSWLKENSVQTDRVEIVNYGRCGYGLKANHDLKVRRFS